MLGVYGYQFGQLIDLLGAHPDVQIDIFPEHDRQRNIIFSTLSGRSASDIEERLATLGVRGAIQRIERQNVAVLHHQLLERGWRPLPNVKMWDDSVPCLLLCVDFGAHPNLGLKPAEPERWRFVDHQTDGTRCGRRTDWGIALDPTDLAKKLLERLSTDFSGWYDPVGMNGRPPFPFLLRFHTLLAEYGLYCYEAFYDGMEEAWYPLDFDSETLRKLSVTALPSNLNDLLIHPGDGSGSEKRFRLIAATQNSD